MEDLKKMYFGSFRKYLKYSLLREHEYYLYKFHTFLRKEEKAGNVFLKTYYRIRKNQLGARLGIYIPAGVFADGLRIWHYGGIVVNGSSKVGRNCTLHGDNCIGNNGDKANKCPVIGNNVDIGTGAKVIGDVYIADGVKIGAGAVVVKSCYTKNATLVGIPAREIKKNG